MPGKKFCVSRFCKRKPWLLDARYKNSARTFRSQSTYTFCCYNHHLAIHSPGMWERLMYDHESQIYEPCLCYLCTKTQQSTTERTLHFCNKRFFDDQYSNTKVNFISSKQLITLYQKLSASKYIRIPWYINHNKHERILRTYL